MDELRGDTNLSTNVAELSSDTQEELVLLSQGLFDEASKIGGLFGLKSHVGIRDFWNWREEEDNGEEGDEGCNADVSPLDVAEIIDNIRREEHSGG